MNSQNKIEEGVSVKTTTALQVFSDLFEKFVKDLEKHHTSFADSLENAWKDYFGADSPSLNLELYQVQLTVLERQLKTLTLLMERRLSDLVKAGDDESSAHVKAFREEAERQLLQIYNRIQDLKVKLNKSNGESSSKFSKLFQKIDQKTPSEVQQESTSSDSEIEVVEQDEGLVEADDIDEITEVPIEEILGELFEKAGTLKDVFKSPSDLKIKTSRGTWTLSLPFYSNKKKGDKRKALLDVENFISINKLAIRGVTDVVDKNSDIDDKQMKVMIKRLQDYLLHLYSNIHSVVAPIGSRILPDVGESFSPDDLLMLETAVTMAQWQQVTDVQDFKQAFENNIAQPFAKHVSEVQNKVRYLKSIVDLAD